jgi:hypothetical protein
MHATRRNDQLRTRLENAVLCSLAARHAQEWQPCRLRALHQPCTDLLLLLLLLLYNGALLRQPQLLVLLLLLTANRRHAQKIKHPRLLLVLVLLGLNLRQQQPWLLHVHRQVQPLLLLLLLLLLYRLHPSSGVNICRDEMPQLLCNVMQIRHKRVAGDLQNHTKQQKAHGAIVSDDQLRAGGAQTC